MILLLSLLLAFQASPTSPTLPTSIPPVSRPIVTGSVVVVHNGDDLQAKYDAASCGSDLVLDAGSVFTGGYVFNKQCSDPDWIFIEGLGCQTGASVIPTYLTLANINSSSNPPWAAPDITNYATIKNTVGVSPITTTDGTTPAKYNYFGCLEVSSPTTSQFQLVALTVGTETLASQLVDHIMLDRVYPHGISLSASIQITHGITVAGSNISVVNSYVSNIYGGESQAILGFHGPGPYLIQNNFLSAASEVIMFGGTSNPPHYSCTVAAGPTTTSATVNTCIDGNNGSVATPAPGTQVMFYTSTSQPLYSPLDSVIISTNTMGALTFPATSKVPLVGVGKVAWGLRPADITITRNYFWKDPCWNTANPCNMNISPASKDFIESKFGQRWNINGNVMVNSWNAGQATAFNFNSTDQNGNCPWCFSSDITFTSNILKNIAGDIGIIGTQNGGGGTTSCPPILNRVLINNNLFFTRGTAPYITGAGYINALTRDNGGCTYPSQQAPDSVQILHNTMLGSNYNTQLSDDNPFNYSNFVIKNNLTEFDQIRWFLVSGGCTEPCFTSNLTTSGTWSASNNAIINSGAINGGGGISDSTMRMRYGPIIAASIVDTNGAMNYSGAGFINYPLVNTDYHNFGLLNSSPFAGQASDGTNPGVNLTILDAALGISPPVPNPPVITSTSPLPGGTNGVPYSFQFAATSSIPVTWSGTSLPGWASLSASGLLTGTPNAATTYSPAITATNSSGADGPHNFSLTTVNSGVAPTITSTSPVTSGTVGTVYSYQFQASGTSPITWSGTNLPAWASLSSTGLLTGNPNSAATTVMHITAMNTTGSNGPTDFSITIVPKPPPLPNPSISIKGTVHL